MQTPEMRETPEMVNLPELLSTNLHAPAAARASKADVGRRASFLDDLHATKRAKFDVPNELIGDAVCNIAFAAARVNGPDAPADPNEAGRELLKRMDRMEQQQAETQALLVAASSNAYKRRINAAARNPEAPLQRLAREVPAAAAADEGTAGAALRAGELPPLQSFPTTFRDANGLTHPQLDALATFYGVDFPGGVHVADRRLSFLAFIGQ